MIIIKSGYEDEYYDESEEELVVDHRIFGGYTDIPWTSVGNFNEGNGNSFIFSMRDDMSFMKIRCLNTKKEVFDDKDLLCCFGNSDLLIDNDCNINKSSESKLGEAYEKPAESEGG